MNKCRRNLGITGFARWRRNGKCAGASLILLAVAMIVTPQRGWAAQCTLSAQGVIFGNYNPLNTQNTDGVGNIAVTCDLGTAYTLTLSTGGGTYPVRVMTSGPNALTYNLYTDTTRLLVWGDGTGGTSTVGGVASSSMTNVPVYGRIPARQNGYVGMYADSIVVTVTF